LRLSRAGHGGHSTNGDNGYFTGGYNGTFTNQTERFVFSSEIGSLLATATLSEGKYSGGDASELFNKGYLAGGLNSLNINSENVTATAIKLTYAAPEALSSVPSANLNVPRYGIATLSYNQIKPFDCVPRSSTTSTTSTSTTQPPPSITTTTTPTPPEVDYYIILDYYWTDGTDLDTRFKLVEPEESSFIGWCKSQQIFEF